MNKRWRDQSCVTIIERGLSRCEEHAIGWLTANGWAVIYCLQSCAYTAPPCSGASHQPYGSRITWCAVEGTLILCFISSSCFFFEAKELGLGYEKTGFGVWRTKTLDVVWPLHLVKDAPDFEKRLQKTCSKMAEDQPAIASVFSLFLLSPPGEGPVTRWPGFPWQIQKLAVCLFLVFFPLWSAEFLVPVRVSLSLYNSAGFVISTISTHSESTPAWPPYRGHFTAVLNTNHSLSRLAFTVWLNTLSTMVKY